MTPAGYARFGELLYKHILSDCKLASNAKAGAVVGAAKDAVHAYSLDADRADT